MSDPTTEPTPIENAHAISVSLRGALFELAANDERSAEQIRERLNEMATATDGLCDLLKHTIEESRPQ